MGAGTLALSASRPHRGIAAWQANTRKPERTVRAFLVFLLLDVPPLPILHDRLVP
jgi:hypothetical protein